MEQMYLPDKLIGVAITPTVGWALPIKTAIKAPVPFTDEQALQHTLYISKIEIPNPLNTDAAAATTDDAAAAASMEPIIKSPQFISWHPIHFKNQKFFNPEAYIVNAAPFGDTRLFFATTDEEYYLATYDPTNPDATSLMGPIDFTSHFPSTISGTAVRRIATLPINTTTCLISLDTNKTWKQLNFHLPGVPRESPASIDLVDIPPQSLFSKCGPDLLGLDVKNNIIKTQEKYYQIQADDPIFSMLFSISTSLGPVIFAATKYQILIYHFVPPSPVPIDVAAAATTNATTPAAANGGVSHNGYWQITGAIACNPTQAKLRNLEKYTAIPMLVDMAHNRLNDTFYYATAVGEISKFPCAEFHPSLADAPPVDLKKQILCTIPTHRYSLNFNFIIGNTIKFTDTHLLVFTGPKILFSHPL